MSNNLIWLVVAFVAFEAGWHGRPLVERNRAPGQITKQDAQAAADAGQVLHFMAEFNKRMNRGDTTN